MSTEKKSTAKIRDPLILHASVDRLMPIDEAILVVGMGKTLWKELVEKKEAPAPVKMPAKILLWRLSDLQEWIRSLPKAA